MVGREPGPVEPGPVKGPSADGGSTGRALTRPGEEIGERLGEGRAVRVGPCAQGVVGGGLEDVRAGEREVVRRVTVDGRVNVGVPGLLLQVGDGMPGGIHVEFHNPRVTARAVTVRARTSRWLAP